MIWRIDIKEKKGVFDSLGAGIQKSIIDLGLASSVSEVHVEHVYNIAGDLTRAQVVQVCRELLTDPVTQQYQISDRTQYQSKNIDGATVVEIEYNPGVMDPVEYSTKVGIKDLGFKAESVSTAKKYILFGKISKKDLGIITDKVLANKIVQHAVDYTALAEAPKGFGKREFNLVHIDLLGADEKQLMKVSTEGQLFLNLNEMKTIQKHFKKLKRNPTDCELETIAQTWSEHCYHKTFRGDIRFTYTDEKGKAKTSVIRNLMKSTIAKATHELNKSWCVSVFHDNAGVIKFDKDDHVCFKAETHNHPSALEPFGGANTGLGGVIRDILGTGLGAKPICSTDVFCFAPPDMDFKDLPPGTLHPKRVMKGVVSGVRDYGNKMGIPTVNGSICFDPLYVGNPLVYCGSVGIMPKDKVIKKVIEGDLAVVVGGRTGRDGIHGATFSSGELTTESEVVSSGAVQIGDPIQEKKVLDALLQARDAGLYTAITDCGAGGLSSAVGEMGEQLGVKVDLDKVPLKYDGLNYEEIWISESQERMVMSVPPNKLKKFLEIFATENVEATVIGTFTGTKRLELFYQGTQVCDLDIEFLYEGTPKITKEAVYVHSKLKDPKLPKQKNLNEAILETLSHYNVCSKEWVVRQYDHEVQGGSIIKPFVGVNCDGPSDAAVVAPKLGSKKGIAVSNGINPQFGKVDPYRMAMSNIDEAIRQIVAVGGDPERIAILDNFCWGNPDKPDRLGSVVRAAQGCYQAAMGYGTPFISGKDSFYNEYTQGKKSIAIPGTLLISAIGIVEDVTKTITMDFKKSGNLIYAIGNTLDEMGGSIYFDTLGCLGSIAPQVDLKYGLNIFQTMFQAIKKGLVRSAHDCSEGGFGVALAEMAFSGGFGVTARLDKVPVKGKIERDNIVLFSETNSRFIVEVEPKNQKNFEKIFNAKNVPFGCIGQVEETPEFIVYGLDDEVCINLYIDDLKEAWKSPLRW